MQVNRNKRKVVLPKVEDPKEAKDLAESLGVAVDEILSDSISLIKEEVKYYSDKVKRGIRLQPEEVMIMTRYNRALVELSKEMREVKKTRDLGSHSDEDLKKMLKEVLGDKE